MSRTANQALGALFGALTPEQKIEFVYRGGMTDGRPELSFQIRGKALGYSAQGAEALACKLQKELELVLAARPGLLFGQAAVELPVSEVIHPLWQGSLQPQGMLVSSGQGLQGIGNGKTPESAMISPVFSLVYASLSVVDAVLSSPELVEVVVSVKRRSLSEADKQGIRTILQAIDLNKAAYFMLPDRRKAAEEEREAWIEPLAHHLKRWLITPWGIELQCHFTAAEKPTEVFMSMLANAIFPKQSVLNRLMFVEGNAETERDLFNHSGALDLLNCINAGGIAPGLFPSAGQMTEIGTKRFYPLPSEEPSTNGLCLGTAGNSAVHLADTDRSRHLYILGATGCGKSTLLYNMVMQDIARGEGVCLMDPHGDLYDDILSSIPIKRQRDVVLIDPSDFGYAVGINFLELTSDYPQVEMSMIVNNMLNIFHRLYDLRQTGGPIFELYIRNALLLVMNSRRGGTLLDVVRVFEDDDYRQLLKAECPNPLVNNFWEYQAEKVRGEASLNNIAPYITSKLNQFTHNSLLRPMIGQRKSTVNFRHIIDNRQILLVNLSKGLLGELDSQLLGMVLIGKLYMAAMGRANVSVHSRSPFNWYIDEFQSFTTDNIAHLLSESRKYGVRMTLANQNMAQLRHAYSETNLQDAVLGNVANLLLFRMGVKDAQQMESYTSPELNNQDLQYLPDYHAVCRLLKQNAPMRPFVVKTLPKHQSLLESSHVKRTKSSILAHSRQHYTRPVADVENEIFESYRN